MGSGAFMRVHHALEDEYAPIVTWIKDVECMYDGGLEGSNLQAFENAVIPHDSAWPPNGPQYIEAIGSGSCAEKWSGFTLHVRELDANIIIEASMGIYNVRDSSTDLLWADINNDWSISKVEITVGPKPKPPT